jgi:Domain of unknown function (DUF4169)
MAILRSRSLKKPLCSDGVAMGDLVNLKRFKKRQERALSEQQAETNRARFGRTKSERAADTKRAKQASDLLDQHRIESEEKA